MNPLDFMMEVTMYCMSSVLCLVVLIMTVAFWIGVFYLCRSFYRAPDKQTWFKEVKERFDKWF